MKIIAADKSGGALFHQFIQKTAPGLTHEFFRHGERRNMVDSGVHQQFCAFLFGADKGGVTRQKQGFGMPVKGNGGGSTGKGLRQCAALPQQGLMPQMYTVKKTQGEYSFVLILKYHPKVNFSLSYCLAPHLLGSPFGGAGKNRHFGTDF